MIKVKISADRIATATNILEYLALQAGDRNTALRLIPRFILDDDGEYIIKVSFDDDGDIAGFDNTGAAALKLTAITPKRSERLIEQVLEAVKQIVNPPNGGDSNKPTSTDTEKPPPG